MFCSTKPDKLSISRKVFATSTCVNHCVTFLSAHQKLELVCPEFWIDEVRLDGELLLSGWVGYSVGLLFCEFVRRCGWWHCSPRFGAKSCLVLKRQHFRWLYWEEPLYPS